MIPPGKLLADRIEWEVLEEHLDEAGFLWTQWEDSLCAPNTTLDELAQREESSLRAHLDGLVLGGQPVAKRLLVPTLEQDDPEQVFASAYALLSSENQNRTELTDLVLDRLETAEEETLGAIQRALELAVPHRLEARLLTLQESENPAVRAAATDILLFHGLKLNPKLADFQDHEHPQVRKAKIRAARHPKGHAYKEAVAAGLSDPDIDIRNTALKTGMVLGMPEAWDTCLRLVTTRQADLRNPLILLGLMGSAYEHDLLISCLEHTECRADAIRALGFVGKPVAAEACLDQMQDPALAKLAGEAFSWITGLDLEQEGLVADPKPRSEPDEPMLPEEDEEEDEDLDQNLAPDPDEDLCLPDVQGIRDWWKKHQSGFKPKVRYLRGKPFGLASFVRALEHGSMRCRQVLAQEAAIRTQGTFFLETRTWTHNQRLQQQKLINLRPKGFFARAWGRPR